MPSNETPCLFVYGTLLQGQPQDGLLAGLPKEPATVPGTLYRMPGGYPALVLDPTQPGVHGELVRIPSLSRFQVLDLYEGVHQGLYQRAQHLVNGRLGHQIHAWIYTITAAQVRKLGLRALKVDDWRKVAPR